MLQLLSPVALVALVSLAIPAVLHLWRPPAKTVRLGSLRFFSGPAVRRLTKLQWRERLLLFVRLLLLAVVVLLLARPIWNKPPPTAPQRWALITPDVLLDGEPLKRWQALKAAGYETRTLTDGFPKAELPDKSRREEAAPADVWSYLREVDARLPAGSQVAVFSSDRIATLRGQRPTLQRVKVEWISLSPNESKIGHWLHSAQLVERAEISDREVHCVVAISSPIATEHVAVDVPAGTGNYAVGERLKNVSVEIADDGNRRVRARLVEADDPSTAATWIDVAPAKEINFAIIHAGDRREDARYLAAALQAVADRAQWKTSVQLTAAKQPADFSATNWIFWLGDEPVPGSLIDEIKDRGIDLFSDAPRSRDSLVSRPSDSILFDFEAPGLNRVRLLRRTGTASGASVWTDSSGQPLLTLEREGLGRRWQFASRFHPGWNDLPRSSALAASLRSLLLHNESEGPASELDQRRADPRQAMPTSLASGGATVAPAIKASPELVDLHHLFWIPALVLFATERALSHRRSKAMTQPPRHAAPHLVEHA